MNQRKIENIATDSLNGATYLWISAFVLMDKWELLDENLSCKRQLNNFSTEFQREITYKGISSRNRINKVFNYPKEGEKDVNLSPQVWVKILVMLYDTGHDITENFEYPYSLINEFKSTIDELIDPEEQLNSILTSNKINAKLLGFSKQLASQKVSFEAWYKEVLKLYLYLNKDKELLNHIKKNTDRKTSAKIYPLNKTKVSNKYGRLYGRTNDLAKMDRILDPENNTRFFNLMGHGGIGKSHLLFYWIEKNKLQDKVLYVNGEPNQGINFLKEKILNVRNLQRVENPVQSIIESLDGQEIILIIDDYYELNIYDEDVKALTRALINGVTSIKSIIVTRGPLKGFDFPTLDHTIELKGIDYDSFKEAIKNYCNNRYHIKYDEGFCKEIHDKIGGWMFAAKQLFELRAQYVVPSGFSEYYELLINSKEEIGIKGLSFTKRVLQDIFKHQQDELAYEKKAELELLSKFSLLNEPVDLKLISKVSQLAYKKFNITFSKLVNFRNLIQLSSENENSYKCHALIRAAASSENFISVKVRINVYRTAINYLLKPFNTDNNFEQVYEVLDYSDKIRNIDTDGLHEEYLYKVRGELEKIVPNKFAIREFLNDEDELILSKSIAGIKLYPENPIYKLQEVRALKRLKNYQSAFIKCKKYYKVDHQGSLYFLHEMAQIAIVYPSHPKFENLTETISLIEGHLENDDYNHYTISNYSKALEALANLDIQDYDELNNKNIKTLKDALENDFKKNNHIRIQLCRTLFNTWEDNLQNEAIKHLKSYAKNRNPAYVTVLAQCYNELGDYHDNPDYYLESIKILRDRKYLNRFKNRHLFAVLIKSYTYYFDHHDQPDFNLLIEAIDLLENCGLKPETKKDDLALVISLISFLLSADKQEINNIEYFKQALVYSKYMQSPVFRYRFISKIVYHINSNYSIYQNINLTDIFENLERMLSIEPSKRKRNNQLDCLLNYATLLLNYGHYKRVYKVLTECDKTGFLYNIKYYASAHFMSYKTLNDELITLNLNSRKKKKIYSLLHLYYKVESPDELPFEVNMEDYHKTITYLSRMKYGHEKFSHEHQFWLLDKLNLINNPSDHEEIIKADLIFRLDTSNIDFAFNKYIEVLELNLEPNEISLYSNKVLKCHLIKSDLQGYLNFEKNNLDALIFNPFYYIHQIEFHYLLKRDVSEIYQNASRHLVDEDFGKFNRYYMNSLKRRVLLKKSG